MKMLTKNDIDVLTKHDVGPPDLLGNGKTLKQYRDEILERTRKSGHYNGLERLELREKDPICYEKLFSKIRGGLVHARETAKKIAASPIVEQEGELCFTLYNAAGDCILTSTGIIIHVGTMGAAIKYMIENDWESNPGIDPGDMFHQQRLPDRQRAPLRCRDYCSDLLGKPADRLGRRRHPCDRHRRGDARLDVDGPSPALRRRLHRHVSQDRRQRQATARLAA
jgi:hypothetical protein